MMCMILSDLCGKNVPPLPPHLKLRVFIRSKLYHSMNLADPRVQRLHSSDLLTLLPMAGG